jgi:hypothetical protein
MVWLDKTEDLDNADDICFLSRQGSYIQTQFTDLARSAEKVSLKMNMQETEVVQSASWQETAWYYNDVAARINFTRLCQHKGI